MEMSQGNPFIGGIECKRGTATYAGCLTLLEIYWNYFSLLEIYWKLAVSWKFSG